MSQEVAIYNWKKINRECFERDRKAGVQNKVNELMKNTYSPRDIHHVEAFVNGVYNPECSLTEDQAQFMLQLNK